MDMTQLEAFVAIARLGSFSKAAAKLHRSQPAISRRISLLEQEVGAALFERIRKRVQLTDAGRALRPHAEAILAAASFGTEAVREQLGQGAGTVALGIVGTLVDVKLAGMLARFAGRQQPPRLTITTKSSEAVSEMVREGEVTVGLRYFVDRGADLECTQIGWEKMVVIAAPSTTGPARACWIGFSTSKLMREEFGRLLLKRLEHGGIDAPDIMVVDSLSAQKRLVEAGFGLGFLPYSSVRRELKEGALVVVDMPSVSTKIPVSLVHRRGGYLSPAARELITILQARWQRGVVPRARRGRAGG